MNVRTGEVMTRSVARNNSEAFTKFLSMLDQGTAPGTGRRASLYRDVRPCRVCRPAAIVVS